MFGLFLVSLTFLALVLYELRRRVPIWPLSPVWLVIGGYLTMGFVGRYAMRWAKAPWGQGFLFITFSDNALDRTLLWFIFITTSFALGALLWVWVSQRPDLPVELSAKLRRQGGGIWLLVAVGVLALVIIGVGPENVVYRTVYLTSSVKWAKILGSAMTPIGVGLCGYIAFGFESTPIRTGAALVALGYFLVDFSLATRAMALVPVLFALGAFCAQPRGRSVRVLFYGGILAAPLLMPFPLVLRDLSEQGLIPFMSALSSGMKLLKHQDILPQVFGNVLMSFPLTTYVARQHPIDTSVLLTCLNPMPGFMTDWYQEVPHLMVNPFTPFNTLGMLMNFGAPVGGGFYLAVGFYFAHADWKIRRELQQGRVLRGLVLFGFLALFLLVTMQYMLRAAVRLIYYALTFEILTGLLLSETSAPIRRMRPARALPQ